MAGGVAADPARAPAVRACLEAIAAGTEDPACEMLALVWGPRFDREHSLTLLARMQRTDSAWLHAMHAFGEHFDALSASDQRALRQDILRIADNAACRASS